MSHTCLAHARAWLSSLKRLDHTGNDNSCQSDDSLFRADIIPFRLIKPNSLASGVSLVGLQWDPPGQERFDKLSCQGRIEVCVFDVEARDAEQLLLELVCRRGA